MSRSFLKTHRAFTLIELLVVIAIMGILLSLGIASLRGISGASNLTTSGFQVAEMLESAREQSILSRAPVAVTMLLNNSDQARRAFAAFQYVPPPSGTNGSWKQVARWEMLPDGVITDSTNSGTGDTTQAFGATSPPMGGGNALPAVTYRGSSYAPGSGYAYLVFLPDGSLYQASKSYQLTLVPGSSDNTGTVTHMGATVNNCQVVINNATGRVRVIRP